MKKLNNHLSHLMIIFIDIFMMACGIMGIVGGFVKSLYFPTSTIYSVYLLIVIGLLLYNGYRKKQAWVKYSYYVYLICIALFIFIFFSDFIMFTNWLMNVIQHNYFIMFDQIFHPLIINNVIFPHFVILCIGFPITKFIVQFIVFKEKSFQKILFLCLLFFFAPLIRHTPDSLSSYCFILFIVYEFIFSYALKNQKETLTLKIVLLPLLAFFLFLSSLVLEPNPIFDQQSSTILANISDWISGDIIEDVFNGNNATGTSTTVDGGLPTTDVTLSHRLALTIESSVPFTSYIRGYSLAHYDENKWNPVKNNNPENFDSLKMIQRQLPELSPAHKKDHVTITSQKKTVYQFAPYFSSLDRYLREDSYYEYANETIDFINRNPFIGSLIDETTHFSMTDYDQYVQKEYLEVPRTLKEKLIQFIQSHQTVDLFQDNISTDLIVQYVHNMLSQNTKYSLKTGTLPANKDFVEYFLLENKKGSCSHYATTMTLMLRCLNIPARYVRGYVVDKSDFENNVAEVYTNRSHAWVEVYYRGYGWVPYEATPQTNDENELSAFAMELDHLLNNDSQDNPSPSTPDTPINDNNPDNQPDTNLPTQQEDIKWYEGLKQYLPIILEIIAVIVVLYVYRQITLNLFKYQIRKLSPNQKVIRYYQRMSKMEKFGGQMPLDILAMSKKAKFSQHKMTGDELQEIDVYYRQYVSDIYQKLPTYKKFIFKYILGYI